MKKIVFLLGCLTLTSIILLYANNPQPEKLSSGIHTKDANGEVILRIKKAKWIYNCIDCHKDFKTRTTPRQLVSDHRNLQYEHIKGNKWCFSCHHEDLDKRNRVYLPKGIYRGPQDMKTLCGQCHGEKTREWEMNIHGKVTGSWKTYGQVKREKKSCESCHSPHHPRSYKVKPEPGPKLRLRK